MEQKNAPIRTTTEKIDEVSRALAAIYSGVFSIDLIQDSYYTISAPDSVARLLDGISSAQLAINIAIQKTVSEDEVLDMISFVNLDTLPSRMKNERFLNTEYKGTLSGWVRGSFIEVARDEQGTLTRVLYTYQVIDEEKRNELEHLQQLKENYSRTEKINKEKTASLEADKKALTDDLDYHNNFIKIAIEQLDCGLLAYTVPGRNILHINSAAMRIFGWENKEEAYKRMADDWANMRLDHESDGEKLLELRRTEGSVKYQFTVNPGKANEKRVLAESKSLSGRHGGKIVMSTFVDITQVTNLEADKVSLTNENAELQQARDAVQTILNSGSYLCTYDLDGELLSIKFSDALRKLYGYTDKEDAPDTWDMWLQGAHPDDRAYVEKCFSDALADRTGNTEYDVTYRALRKNGEVRWHRAAGYVMRREDGTPASCYGLVMDVDKQKKAEDQAKEALKQAKLANEAKTAFLARMSHDIRTPMNGIQGLIAINEKHADDIAFTSKNRKKAKVAADHLLSLINDVLQLSKLEDPNIELANEPFDIQKLLDDVFTIIEMKANENGIDVRRVTDVKAEEYPYVWGSPLHVRQIFINILGNAVKYNRKNGSIRCQISAKQTEPGKVLYRAVMSDTGIGMSEEFLQHLFDPFSREHEDTTGREEGTGLGMSIVKQLVDKMGGKLQVESRAGEGSCFTLELPFAIAGKEDLERTKEEEISADITGKKILLVEDNDLNLDIAETLLTDMGAEITGVRNGQQAIDIFMSHPPGTFDVILMDIMMPVMNGYEATRKIRELRRPDAGQIPIIAMTANAFAEDVEKARKAGMNDHLSKPLDTRKMECLIAKYTRT